MKIRESGMPKEQVWSSFFEPDKILSLMGLDRGVADVADFGCGYGTFTIPAASMVSGTVYAVDIEPQMIEQTNKKARELNLGNIKTILRDFVSEGSGLHNASVDFVMLFNILHFEKPATLLKEAYRILRTNGKVGIIHWNYDSTTPRGPPMDMRPKPEQVRQWAESVGFVFEEQFDLKPFHYGMLLRKVP